MRREEYHVQSDQPYLYCVKVVEGAAVASASAQEQPDQAQQQPQLVGSGEIPASPGGRASGGDTGGGGSGTGGGGSGGGSGGSEVSSETCCIRKVKRFAAGSKILRIPSEFLSSKVCTLPGSLAC